MFRLICCLALFCVAYGRIYEDVYDKDVYGYEYGNDPYSYIPYGELLKKDLYGHEREYYGLSYRNGPYENERYRKYSTVDYPGLNVRRRDHSKLGKVN